MILFATYGDIHVTAQPHNDSSNNKNNSCQNNQNHNVYSTFLFARLHVLKQNVQIELQQ